MPKGVPGSKRSANLERRPGQSHSVERAISGCMESLETTRRLATFIHDLRLSDLSHQVLNHSVRVIRDTLGVMLAGATLPEVRGLAEMVKMLDGTGRASLMGRQEKCSPHFAALVNGTGAVSLELDEGNQYAVNHPSVHIFPVALALGEELGRSGAELLTAFVAGYEVAVRIGRATHLRDAVHPFGTHTIIGTAASAAKLLNLDSEQTARALDLAGGLSIASSQTAANRGASARNLVTGLTNHNGLLAALLVRAGFTGEPGSLNVVFGQILGDSFQDDRLAEDLGEEFYITKNYFKLHACSRWNHAPIEAVSALLGRTPFKAADVDEITVWTYDPATRLDWSDPPNGYAAKHSIPYNVAVRIIRGTNGLEAYSDEAVSDPQIRALARQIVIREDPDLTAMLPDVRPARVEVKLRSGTVLKQSIDRPRGGFDNPFTEDELEEKFKRLAGMIIPASSVLRLEQMLHQLPEIDNIRSISPLLEGNNVNER